MAHPHELLLEMQLGLQTTRLIETPPELLPFQKAVEIKIEPLRVAEFLLVEDAVLVTFGQVVVDQGGSHFLKQPASIVLLF
jgi:hypothetical protein